jgi:hypothetical protein
MLVRFGILHNGRGPSIHREHNGTLALPEMPHEISRLAAKAGQRLNVFRDVKHGSLSYQKHLLRCSQNTPEEHANNSNR